MKRFAARVAVGLVVVAATMSVVWTFLLRHGGPWPSLACAAVACAAAVWLARISTAEPALMSDVIRGVEDEPARLPGGPLRNKISARTTR
jgi:hypothetical protein